MIVWLYLNFFYLCASVIVKGIKTVVYIISLVILQTENWSSALHELFSVQQLVLSRMSGVGRAAGRSGERGRGCWSRGARGH